MKAGEGGGEESGEEERRGELGKENDFKQMSPLSAVSAGWGVVVLLLLHPHPSDLRLSLGTSHVTDFGNRKDDLEKRKQAGNINDEGDEC